MAQRGMDVHRHRFEAQKTNDLRIFSVYIKLAPVVDAVHPQFAAKIRLVESGSKPVTRAERKL
jgi:hypothetical protein